MPDATNDRTRSQSAPAQTRARPAQRTADRPAGRPLTDSPLTQPAAKAAAAKQAPGLQLEAPIVAAGRDGATNIALEKYWVEVDGHLPCGFTVATLDGHGLEVVQEQLSYRKVYTGVGSIRTNVTPVAPIGTKGRIVVTDTTTGETCEQPWTWQLRGGGGGGLWAMIKRLFWNG
jgi:hypothetical protein